MLLRSRSSMRAGVLTSLISTWRTIAPLLPGTATIAAEPLGQLAALSVSDSRLTVWQQGSKGTGWQKEQPMTVPISFGSSD